MLKHYVIIAWRNISRKRLYSVLLTFGLALGIASATLLGMYTWHELTVDNFHEKKDRIFLVAPATKEGVEENVDGWSTPPTGPALANYFPEIESYARMCTWFEEVVVTKGDRKFVETGLQAADSSIFNVFTIDFISGNPKTALREPNSIVVTETFAKKYFGDKDPMGQTLQFDHFFSECVVTGVVKDYPDNGHFDFDVLLSLSSLQTIRFNFDHWMNHTFVTYVLLNENADVKSVEAKMTDFVKENLGAYLIQRYQKTYDEMYVNGDYYRLTLVPLPDIHLGTLLYENNEGKKLLVYAMGAIGIIILVLVCINYVNLATVLSFGRAKEAGIRKVSGSGNKSLFNQFVIESIILSLIGLVIGIGIVEMATPLFNSLTGQDLHLDYTDPFSIGGLVLFSLFVGAVSGIIPATTFASFSPVKVLKGASSSFGRPWLRNFLIVVQFTICVLMIASTIIVYNQLNFMTTQNIGFAKDQILVVKRPEGLKANKTAFKNELLKQSGIEKISFTETIPGHEFNGHGQHIVGTPDTEVPTIFPLVADKDIFETLDLKIVQGKDFTEFAPDRPKAILNETAVNQLNLKDPLSVKLDRGTMGSQEVDVVGVVKDFHFKSFHHEVEPLVIYLYDVDNDPQHRSSYVLLKLTGSDIPATVAAVEAQWKKFAGNYPFDYVFLDDDFSRLFDRETKMAKVYTVFSTISILIACLGLVGLISWFAERRSKEIGIRKIVGATLPAIVVLLSRDFMKLLLISIAIGSSLSYYLMNSWVEGFAYRTQLSWWIFALAGGVTIMLSFAAVGWNLVKAATRNPVETLKSE